MMTCIIGAAVPASALVVASVAGAVCRVFEFLVRDSSLGLK
ncbi:hypothetical protein [Corynebacterium matruchotii]|nr:hypothetical protein [Corynebacterium matruchotii]